MYVIIMVCCLPLGQLVHFISILQYSWSFISVIDMDACTIGMGWKWTSMYLGCFLKILPREIKVVSSNLNCFYIFIYIFHLHINVKYLIYVAYIYLKNTTHP
jgi:hypothetical protein